MLITLPVWDEGNSVFIGMVCNSENALTTLSHQMKGFFLHHSPVLRHVNVFAPRNAERLERASQKEGSVEGEDRNVFALT